MTKIKDGGSAFPSGVEEVKYPENGGAITSIKMQPANKGMTLRDYFAAKAMQGLLSNKHMGDAALHGSAQEWLKEMSEAAYEFADAMLAERERGE